MKFRFFSMVCGLCLLACAPALAGPQLWFTGVTSYNPQKAWNGYTIMAGDVSAKLIDMNGNLVHEWDLRGGDGMPNKIYPGGHLLTSLYPSYNQAGQGHNTIALLDFEGKIVRSFNHYYQVKKPSEGMPKDADGTAWVSRQHHDYQIEGSTTGYYYPDAKPNLKDGKMLVLSHRNVVNNKVVPGDVKLQDDWIYIVDAKGEIIWTWSAADHVEEFALTSPENKALMAAKAAIAPKNMEAAGYDWFHINCASWLGPNKWFDAGDQRFHPDNIIADSRETAMLFIIDHKTGKVVWLVRPDDKEIGPLYGVHHTHMIPKGLPGEGNILVYDNGGENAVFKSLGAQLRSEILEIDPVAMKVVWQYPSKDAIKTPAWRNFGDVQFFSWFISSAQRMPNGNTVINEGNKNRIFEVTKDGDIVWDYVSPYNYKDYPMTNAYIYRSYRVPYDWVPQLQKPREVPVTPRMPVQFQLPNDEGVYPNIAPTKDDKSLQRILPRVTLNMGAAKAAAPAAEDDDEQPGMKAY